MVKVAVGALACLLSATSSAAQGTFGSDCPPRFAEGFGPSNGLGDGAWAMAVFDEDGAGPGAPALFVAGSFGSAGGQSAGRIARWNGTAWTTLGSGAFNGVNQGVRALAVFDEDGPGPGAPALFVGGAFTAFAGQPASYIARWNGSAWSTVGPGPLPSVGSTVHAIAVFDEDGPGPNGPGLFVGGDFVNINAGGQPASRIARWNGSAWSAVGSGVANGVNGFVRALTVFDEDGPGPGSPALYVGGRFSAAGGVPTNNIARWDGSAWSAVGSGDPNGVDSWVYALAEFDEDAEGPRPAALFVGGLFAAAGGQPAASLARWDGVSWSVVGSASANGVNGSVNALGVFDEDGPGPGVPDLFVGGRFSVAGGASARNVAKWDGSAWGALGGDFLTNGVSGDATAFGVFDEDGPGSQTPALFVGGFFLSAGGTSSFSIAKWYTPPCAPPTGACCTGVTCSVRTQDACVGAATRFVGAGSVCDAAGNVTTPCCRADFNQDGVRAPADIFALLDAYFSTDAGTAALTDFDGSGTRQPADLFAFLNAYFAGGC